MTRAKKSKKEFLELPNDDQVKNSKMEKKLSPAVDLRGKYLKLPNDDQMGITHFFNLHNAAHFVYDKLSKEAQAYVNYCIRMSQEATHMEKHPEQYEQTDD